MACEYLKVLSETGVALWFDLARPFDDDLFLKTLGSSPNFKVIGKKVIFQSQAPAEIIQEVTTSEGAFYISKQFEGLETGVDIYSKNSLLMEKILGQLEASGLYRARVT